MKIVIFGHFDQITKNLFVFPKNNANYCLCFFTKNEKGKKLPSIFSRLSFCNFHANITFLGLFNALKKEGKLSNLKWVFRNTIPRKMKNNKTTE